MRKNYRVTVFISMNTTMYTYEGTGERIDTRLSKQFAYSRSFFHHIISR